MNSPKSSSGEEESKRRPQRWNNQRDLNRRKEREDSWSGGREGERAGSSTQAATLYTDRLSLLLLLPHLACCPSAFAAAAALTARTTSCGGDCGRSEGRRKADWVTQKVRRQTDYCFPHIPCCCCSCCSAAFPLARHQRETFAVNERQLNVCKL